MLKAERALVHPSEIYPRIHCGAGGLRQISPQFAASLRGSAVYNYCGRLQAARSRPDFSHSVPKSSQMTSSFYALHGLGFARHSSMIWFLSHQRSEMDSRDPLPHFCRTESKFEDRRRASTAPGTGRHMKKYRPAVIGFRSKLARLPLDSPALRRTEEFCVQPGLGV